LTLRARQQSFDVDQHSMQAAFFKFSLPNSESVLVLCCVITMLLKIQPLWQWNDAHGLAVVSKGVSNNWAFAELKRSLTNKTDIREIEPPTHIKNVFID